MEYHNRK